MKNKLLLSSLFTLTLGTSPADLIAYWDFENDFLDQSGNSNDGTAVGTTTLDTSSPAAAGSGSLKLVNADDSYLDINPGSGMQIEQNENFTISIWVRSSTIQRDKRIFSEASTTNQAPLYNLGTGAPGDGTNQVDFFRRTVDSTTNNHELTTAEPFGDDTWHNVVLVDANGEIQIYVDGIPDLSTSYSKASIASNTTTFGGIKREGTCCGFSGSLDDIGVWNTALTPLQIQAIHQGVSPTLIDENIDSDSDGLPDYWELLYNLDPSDDGSTDVINGPAGDPDSDSLSNLDELANRTVPRIDDTDGDTIPDGEEIEPGLDGYITDPLSADTDNDLISDPDEIAAGSDPSTPNPPAPIPTEGLIHLWSFDDVEGTTALDSVGGVNGTWVGAETNLTWTDQGILGGAADLAGQSGDGNHFTLETLGIEGGNQMTISLWFQNDGNTDTGYNALFMSRPENWGIAVENSDQHADFRFDNAGGGSQGYDSEPVLTRDGDIWHHAAMSVDLDTGEIIYALDGQTTVATKVDGALAISGIGWAIGNDGSTGTNRDFDGRLDDLAIWEKALTEDDLKNIYLNGLRGNAVAATGPSPLTITGLVLNEDGSGSLTWNSKPGATYRIAATPDLTLSFEDWPIELDDQRTADAEVTTLQLPAGFVSPERAKVFFAVQEVE